MYRVQLSAAFLEPCVECRNERCAFVPWAWHGVQDPPEIVQGGVIRLANPQILAKRDLVMLHVLSMLN